MQIKYDQQGLIPCVVQNVEDKQVLMVAWMNTEALNLTQETGQVHFWSRSREEIWRKGATSGNTLQVVEIWADCDSDTLLIKAIPAGPACHTGEISCFFRKI